MGKRKFGDHPPVALSELDVHGFYNKTIHECQLKLHLPLEIINGVYKNLYNKNEVSGVLYFDSNNELRHIDKNVGNAESVYTPNNVINYHTHPINAYRNGKTAYGAPSGEDYRETLKFALAGNKAHLVFTVEGLYTIQVSPCKIKKLQELLNDEQRGILIFFIEEYFKTTHGFRCTDELNELSTNNIHLSPYSFVDFANNFDIPNLLTNKKYIFKTSKNISIDKTGHSGITTTEKNTQMYAGGLPQNYSFSRIPNMGYPSVVGNYFKTVPGANHLTKDDLGDLRSINKNGKESPLDRNSIHELVQELSTIATLFNSVPCNINWNTSNKNAWFFVNFFPTEHFLKEYHKNKSGYIMPLKDANGLQLTYEPFIRVFSNNKKGCKYKDIAQTHNFNMGKKFTFGSHKQRKSTFGKFATLYKINSDIQFLKILNV